MTVIIYRWMEVYPEKMDGTPHHMRIHMTTILR